MSLRGRPRGVGVTKLLDLPEQLGALLDLLAWAVYQRSGLLGVLAGEPTSGSVAAEPSTRA